MAENGLSQDRLILLDAHLVPNSTLQTIESLISEYNTYSPILEYSLKEGEAKTKIAFLCFSSGTTGLPKVCCTTGTLHWTLIILYTGSSRLALQRNEQRCTNHALQPCP